MTDKTPQIKEECTMNTQEELSDLMSAEIRGNTQSTESNIEILKCKFKEGSIPLQNDFAELIDMAGAGFRAVGKDTNQKGLANGFTLDEGRLKLKPAEDKGIGVDEQGVFVKAGKGIRVDDHGVNVALNARGALTCGDQGLAINLSDSVGVKNGALCVKINEYRGLESTPQGLAYTPMVGMAVLIVEWLTPNEMGLSGEWVQGGDPMVFVDISNAKKRTACFWLRVG